MFKSKGFRGVTSVIKSVTGNNDNTIPSSKLFELQEVNRHGLSGKVVSFAYNPIQSLLAVATDTGEVHIYGKQQVEVVFTLNVDIVVSMRFVKGIYLVIIDSLSCIVVLSLYSKKVLTSFYPPGKITCVETDPCLDWMLIGLQSGTIAVYDIDRDVLSSVKIENLQKEHIFPHSPISPVISIQWHPRDLGTVLISYDRCTVLYSLFTNKVKQRFVYELEPFAPGGLPGENINMRRTPAVIQSLCHPNGLHILTVHEDNSLVFWDANSGRLIQARSLSGTDVNVPTKDISVPNEGKIHKVLWVCEADPQKTSLIVMGGTAKDNKVCQDLTIIDLGSCPKYSVASYEKMSNHYSSPVSKKTILVSGKGTMVDAITLARKSPYYAGNHDPGVILVLFDSGEIESLLYPSGQATYKSSLFPQGLSWVRPEATRSYATTAPCQLWLGMMASTSNKDHLLHGGIQARRKARVLWHRSILLTGHAMGCVRIWDGSHRELSDSSAFEINVAQVLENNNDAVVDNISYSSDTAELAVSINSGDVVLYRFQDNVRYDPQASSLPRDKDLPPFSVDRRNILVDVSSKTPRNFREGFCPITAIQPEFGKVTALTNSNIGFVAIGYEDGTLIVVDRREPNVMYIESITKLTKAGSTYFTKVEFCIMSYGEDSYSSILMIGGTNRGELIIFKILPTSTGRFTMKPVDSVTSVVDGPVANIEGITNNGNVSCKAVVSTMKNLTEGGRIEGVLIITGPSVVKVLLPGLSRVSQTSFRRKIATSGCSFITYKNGEEESINVGVFVVLTANCEVRVLSLPNLTAIKTMVPQVKAQAKYIGESAVLANGDIMLRTGQSEAWLLTIMKDPFITGENIETDSIYNSEAHIHARPHISSRQWVLGTMIVKPEDVDELLGGDARRPPTHEESALAKKTLLPSSTLWCRSSHCPPSPEPTTHHKPGFSSRRTGGPWRTISRTVHSGVDYIEDTVNEYATAANQSIDEAVSQTREGIVKGMFKSKLGL
ncbi:HEL039Cp [Eremothecium sinecaudum]|uniref:HEL039Cp n=1 Tax=Eremothecium sinecaudum TaxID=45286 RepID=A0A109UZG7_9SACH|nr:HEL039Cp [Eremothecium sinecaudum]AMD21241.1 HEL039Cp [Eremothecium sinecaudum]